MSISMWMEKPQCCKKCNYLFFVTYEKYYICLKDLRIVTRLELDSNKLSKSCYFKKIKTKNKDKNSISVKTNTSVNSHNLLFKEEKDIDKKTNYEKI